MSVCGWIYLKDFGDLFEDGNVVVVTGCGECFAVESPVFAVVSSYCGDGHLVAVGCCGGDDVSDGAPYELHLVSSVEFDAELLCGVMPTCAFDEVSESCDEDVIYFVACAA